MSRGVLEPELGPLWLVDCGGAWWHWVAAAVGVGAGLAWPDPSPSLYPLLCVGAVLWAAVGDTAIPPDTFLLATVPLTGFARPSPVPVWVVQAVGLGHWVYAIATQEGEERGAGALDAVWVAALSFKYVAGAPSRAWAGARAGVVALRLACPRRALMASAALVLTARCPDAGRSGLPAAPMLLALGTALATAALGSWAAAAWSISALALAAYRI
jgi:hypothetical protein